MVGRNASNCLRSICSRTTGSWRERVQMAYHARPAFTGEDTDFLSQIQRQESSAGLFLPGQAGLVGLLDLVVLPLDERLVSQLLEIFLHLGVLLFGADVFGNPTPRILERQCGR